MSEIIYQSKHSGKKIDDSIDKVDVLSQQMEHKADKADALVYEAMFDGSGDLNTANKINKWYKINGATGVLHLPPYIDGGKLNNSALYIHGQITDSFIQIFYAPQINKIYHRSYCSWNTTPWSNWSTQADTDKIDILSTDFKNGWHTVSGTSFYINKANNTVQLMGFIEFGTVTTNTVILTLPPSIRPTEIRYVIANSDTGSVARPLKLSINTNGDVTLLQSSDQFINFNGLSYHL